MTIATLAPPASQPVEPPAEGSNYLNVSYGVVSWLLTKDHKRIAILYLISVTAMFLLGGLAISIVRLQPDDARREASSRPTRTTACSRCTA